MTERRVQRTQERLAQLSQASENALKEGENSVSETWICCFYNLSKLNW